MDAGEIFGATLLAIAALGCIILISFTLAMNTRKFIDKTFKKTNNNEAPLAVPDSEQNEEGRAALGNTSEPHAQVASNLSQEQIQRQAARVKDQPSQSLQGSNPELHEVAAYVAVSITFGPGAIPS